MGVYNKGMDMPKACAGCPLVGANGDVLFCRYVGYVSKMVHKRHENCPLVELPKHGRLIDTDKLMDDICSALNEMTRIGIAVDGEWLWGKLNDAIDNAQTVIEAED